MQTKLLKTSFLGYLSLSVSLLPFTVSTSCGTNTIEEKKEFYITTGEGFSLSNKEKAIENKPWTSDLLINEDNHKIVVDIQVKQIDDKVLQLGTDYSWTWNNDSDSVVGQINIINPINDIFIFVNSVEKTDSIVYNADGCGYIYPDCPDDFEFLYLDSSLPEDNAIKADIVSIVDESDSSIQYESDLLSSNVTTSIENRKFNVSIGLNQGKSFDAETLKCLVTINFNYLPESGNAQSKFVSVPVEINKEPKQTLVFPYSDSEDEPKDRDIIYTVSTQTSRITAGFILNEKRAPINNSVYVSVLPQFTDKIYLESPVCKVQPFHDYFQFSVYCRLAKTDYTQTTDIEFGLNFEYAKSNYTNCKETTSGHNKYFIHLTLEQSVINVGNKIGLYTKYNDSEINPAYYQLNFLNPVDEIVSDRTKINDHIKIEIINTESKSISTKFKCGTLSWVSMLDGNYIFSIPVEPISTENPDNETFTFEITTVVGSAATILDDTVWKSPTYEIMSCKSPDPSIYLDIDANNVLRGFNSNFKNGDKKCDDFNALVIPASIKEIAQKAFYGYADGGDHDLRLKKSKIQWLIFPNKLMSEKSQLTKIGNCAFEECTNLKGLLYIPSTVQTIENYAFKNCTGFNQLLFATGDYGETDYSQLSTIGKEAFYKFGNQNSFVGGLNLPKSVKTLDVRSFASTPFDSINFPESLESNSKYYFDGKKSQEYFKGCSKLVNVNGGLPSKTDKFSVIPSYIFQNASNFKGATLNKENQQHLRYLNAGYKYCLEIPKDIYVDFHTFENTGIEILILNNGNVIEDWAFHDCDSLKIIDLSNITKQGGTIPKIMESNSSQFKDIGITNGVIIVNDEMSDDISAIKKQFTDVGLSTKWEVKTFSDYWK